MLKLAATTFRCFEAWLRVRAELSLVTILPGSGLKMSGTPLGRNWATSLDGWWDELGLLGILAAWEEGVCVLCLAVAPGCWGGG